MRAPAQRYLVRRADPADVEDLVAEVLLVLWRRLDDVPPGAGLPWADKVAEGVLAKVTAAEGNVNGCGYSGLATPELERAFTAAFGG